MTNHRQFLHMQSLQDQTYVILSNKSGQTAERQKRQKDKEWPTKHNTER